MDPATNKKGRIANDTAPDQLAMAKDQSLARST
jgi:hypothetical protein